MVAKIVKKIKLNDKKATEKIAVTETAPKLGKKRATPKVARVAVSPIVGIGRYIKGSWEEIRQVRWPNRKATWGMTLAVMVFTAFFAAIILLLDSAFQLLFKEFLLK